MLSTYIKKLVRKAKKKVEARREMQLIVDALEKESEQAQVDLCVKDIHTSDLQDRITQIASMTSEIGDKGQAERTFDQWTNF